ncbi:L,D-transpeptidase [Coxiella burnetii]|uniref:Enhanced entry protein n=1 Tax=Coxiella burnetii (strain Dugway 5J108-111) TaxID=434922 RepID=A9KBQ7_COXBN|nr:L,D-transpeptidase [Coxiella burnetii]ABS78318.1 enhanced entry protein [Coxiella burnetii Dugway 5J108-111]ACJ20633.1 enhanced entry protein [Coxiella burnetii CbuK_Q154]AIT63704.1 Enhanced entry protein EnhA [Coxiella burnetii str. Namibia]ATN86253.1 endopeptidase IV [Coxiella burnetii str. Schperling]EAX33044.1 L,D-transpeptidase [Coxiella burnetii 'MSU Goat Q177']
MKITVTTIGALISLMLGQPLIAAQVKSAGVLNPHSFIQLAAAKPAAQSGRLFVFDPKRHRWYAYQNGRLIKQGRASGGAYRCPKNKSRSCRTPSGTFRIIRKGPPNCKSTRYPKPHGGARMDYCMCYHAFYCIHGSDHVPNYHASHGCIRVTPADARWLSHNFIQYGTKVVVKSY